MSIVHKSWNINYAVRCTGCRSQNFAKEYDSAPLTCVNCGLVGCTEKVPDVSYLETELENFHIQKPFMDASLLQMMTEMEVEMEKNEEKVRKEKYANTDLSSLMGSLKIGYKTRKSRKRPSKKNTHY
jgi:transcription initiation factor TFIIIB Brf1 subunit/transcription initiation factor TFIIB